MTLKWLLEPPWAIDNWVSARIRNGYKIIRKGQIILDWLNLKIKFADRSDWPRETLTALENKFLLCTVFI